MEKAQEEKIIRELSDIFFKRFGRQPEILKLKGEGSDRKYFRMKSPDGLSAIGAWNEDTDENKAFIELACLLRERGILVPEIYSSSSDGRIYLQEDLGDCQLITKLDKDRDEIINILFDSLVKFQTLSENSWINLTFYPAFNRRQVFWDLNYFKYSFLKIGKYLFNENKLEDDFEKLGNLLINIPEEEKGLMYRDFQSRNIMIKDESFYFIDFQGARKGPLLYDPISFLWQVKAKFTMKERNDFLNLYMEKLQNARPQIEFESMKRNSKYLIIFRMLQVLGAYGFRGLIEGKPHFLESLTGAKKNLKIIIENGWMKDFPELQRVCGIVVN